MRALVILGAVASITLVVIGVLAPAQAVRVYVLGLLALAGSIVVRRMLDQFGALERTSARRPSSDGADPPAFFARAVRRVDLASSSGVYFEQLRPRLLEIADQRFAVRGVRPKSREAHELLGDEAWRALNEPPGDDKFAPPPEGRVARVISALGRM